MKNGIDNPSPYSSRQFSIIALVIIMIIIVTAGVAGIYSFYKSSNKAVNYFNALKDVKDIKLTYKGQIATWKYMLDNKDKHPVFNQQYYKFSKSADIMQDKLFNLKVKYLTEAGEELAEKINKLKLFHQKTSEKYVAVIFEESIEGIPLDPPIMAAFMERDEAKIFDDLEIISRLITALAADEIDMTRYYLMIAALLIILIILAVIMIILIAGGKRRYKYSA